MASGCVSTSRSLLPWRSCEWSSKRSARKWCSSRSERLDLGAHRAVEHEDAFTGEFGDRMIGEGVGAGDGHATPFSVEELLLDGAVLAGSALAVSFVWGAIGSVVPIDAEPDGDGQAVGARGRREVADVGTVETGQVEPVADLVVVEAETAMGLRVAQELVAVRGEVDDEQPPVGRHEPRRFEDRPSRIVEVVEHLVDHDEVEARGVERRAVHVALPEFVAGDATAFEVGPGHRQHRMARVDPDRTDRPRAEQLEDASGAGAEIDEPADVTVADHVADRRFDRRFGGVERTLLVPDRRDLLEVPEGVERPAFLHARQPAPVGDAVSDRCRRRGRARRRAMRPSARRRRAGRRPTCLPDAWRRCRHRRAA